MKKILFVLVAAISVVSSVGQAVRFYISTNDLVAASHNPSSQNPLGIVLDTNDFSYTTWEWWGDSTITNTPGPLYLQSLRPGVDGSYVLFENLHWNRAPDLGGSNIFVVINNTNQGGIVGALTVPYLPRAINTNRLADSHLYWTTDGTGTDTNLFFGPGKTNVFYRTNGTDLAYWNGYTTAKFIVGNGSGRHFWILADGAGGGIGTDGVSSSWGITGQTLYQSQAYMSLYPATDNVTDFGYDLLNLKATHQRTNYVYAYHDPLQHTNTVRLETSMNGPVAIFDITAKTNNVNGPITGYSLQTNGVPLLTISGGLNVGSAELILSSDDNEGYVDAGVDRDKGMLGVGNSNADWELFGSTNDNSRLQLLGTIDGTNVVVWTPGIVPTGAAIAYTMTTTHQLSAGDLVYQWMNRDQTNDTLAASAGWTGTGNKVKTDNGTYQYPSAVAGSSANWTTNGTANPATDSSLAGTATVQKLEATATADLLTDDFGVSSVFSVTTPTNITGVHFAANLSEIIIQAGETHQAGAWLAGQYSYLRDDAATGSTNEDLRAQANLVRINDGDVVNNLHGIYSDIALAGSAYASNIFHFRAVPSAKSGSATIGTEYGFYAGNFTSATNKYAFYSAGPASHFGAADFDGTLEMNGSAQIKADGSVSAPAFATSANGNMGMYRAANNQLGWSISGGEAMRINSTGLGVGTNAPSEKLEVAGNIKASGDLSLAGTASVGGLTIGTNTISGDGGTPALPQWNGAAWPGGGGLVIWTNYATATDMEGGTIYGSYVLSPQLDALISYSVNFMTNWWDDFGLVVSIDSAPINVMQLSVSNYNVFAFGDHNFFTTPLQLNADLFGIGVYNFAQASLTNSQGWQGYGEYNGWLAGITNSNLGFSFGEYNFSEASVNDCLELFGFGDYNFDKAILANCTYDYGIGYNNFLSASLSGSTSVYAFGVDNGTNLVGTFDHIFLMGSQAQPTTNANQIVLAANQTRINSPGLIEMTGPISTGGNTNRWIFKGLTVDGGVTNAHCTINGTNFFWAVNPE